MNAPAFFFYGVNTRNFATVSLSRVLRTVLLSTMVQPISHELLKNILSISSFQSVPLSEFTTCETGHEQQNMCSAQGCDQVAVVCQTYCRAHLLGAVLSATHPRVITREHDTTSHGIASNASPVQSCARGPDSPPHWLLARGLVGGSALNVSGTHTLGKPAYRDMNARTSGQTMNLHARENTMKTICSHRREVDGFSSTSLDSTNKGSPPNMLGHGNGIQEQLNNVASIDSDNSSPHFKNDFLKLSANVHNKPMRVAKVGGKKCLREGCSRSARDSTNFCISHGGGKRCQALSCKTSARGSSGFCKAHGGGVRCQVSEQGRTRGLSDIRMHDRAWELLSTNAFFLLCGYFHGIVVDVSLKISQVRVSLF